MSKIPRPFETVPPATGYDALVEENKRLRELLLKSQSSGPIARAHRTIALAMDKIIPPGWKTKLFSLVLAAMAAGPSAAAGVIPLPPHWRNDR